MAANTIVFESEYMRGYAKTVEQAKTLVEEANSFLKRANRHDGWRCSERQQVNDSLGGLSSKLTKIINGLGETNSSLTKGAGQFAELESRAQKEESSMYGKLNKEWAFEAEGWRGGKPIKLPILPIPLPRPPIGYRPPWRLPIIRPLPWPPTWKLQPWPPERLTIPPDWFKPKPAPGDTPTAPTPDTGTGSTPTDQTTTPGTGSTPTDQTTTPGTGSTPTDQTTTPGTGSTPADQTATPGTETTPTDQPTAEDMEKFSRRQWEMRQRLLFRMKLWSFMQSKMSGGTGTGEEAGDVGGGMNNYFTQIINNLNQGQTPSSGYANYSGADYSSGYNSGYSSGGYTGSGSTGYGNYDYGSAGYSGSSGGESGSGGMSLFEMLFGKGSADSSQKQSFDGIFKWLMSLFATLPVQGDRSAASGGDYYDGLE